MPFANNNGIKIHYKVEGQGPALVLQHGFGGSLENWHDNGFARELSKDYRLILVDARGCGGSDKPHEMASYDFKFIVQDLVAILDSLKIDKASYLGYSMGGRIGFRLPMYAPTRFNTLIIGGASYPTRPGDDGKDDILTSVQKALEKALKEEPESSARAMEIYVAEREKELGPQLPQAKARALKNDPRALFAAIRTFREHESPLAKDYLPKIDLPCLFYVGEDDPRFAGVRDCAKLIPKATFFSLPGLNHLQANQKKELVLPHIRKFLAGVSRNIKK